jgi:hypothetical protein
LRVTIGNKWIESKKLELRDRRSKTVKEFTEDSVVAEMKTFKE